MNNKNIAEYYLALAGDGDLPRFYLSDMRVGGKSIFSIGKRRVGKTTLAMDILANEADKEVVLLGDEMCREKYVDEYKDVIPADNIWKTDDKNRLNNLMETQGKNIRNGVEEIKSIIFEDSCSLDSSFWKDDVIRGLYYTNRSYRLNLITILQYAVNINPSIRENADYLFIFRDMMVANRKKIYDQWIRELIPYETFCQYMDDLEGYECIVMDYRNDRIYKYCPEEGKL